MSVRSSGETMELGGGGSSNISPFGTYSRAALKGCGGRVNKKGKGLRRLSDIDVHGAMYIHSAYTAHAPVTLSRHEDMKHICMVLYTGGALFSATASLHSATVLRCSGTS